MVFCLFCKRYICGYWERIIYFKGDIRLAILSGGEIVTEVLKKEGVKKAFCVPGESYLGVIDALYEHPQIQLISTRHEGGASFMADAYAKASGEVGVCMATRGPGATNLSVGLHNAMQDSTPVVALIGQVERAFKGREAFQEIEFSSFFSHICKWAVEIDTVERIPEILHRAFYTARSGRPGPVVVSLPHDMLEDTTEYIEGTVYETSIPEVGEETIDRVLKKLVQAKQPVIIAGGGVTSTRSNKELEKFAEIAKIPVVSSFRRFDVIRNTHPNYAGWLGFGPDKNLLDYIRTADVVLSIGCRFSQVTTQDYSLIDEGTEIIQVDIDAASIGKAYPVALGVVSDAGVFLRKCLQRISEVNDPKRKELVKRCHESYLKASTPPPFSENKHFADMNYIIKEFLAHVPEDTIITSDAGNFFSWITRYYRFKAANTCVGTTAGTMGYGLPAAIGAKLACEDKQVVSFSGDGGFMMTMQEFETAVRHQIPIISIVVNNNMYGTIRSFQEKQFPGRVISTRLTNPNFAEMAKLFGGDGVQVRKNDDFPLALEQALQSKQPFIIEVVTDPELLPAN